MARVFSFHPSFDNTFLNTLVKIWIETDEINREMPREIKKLEEESM